MVVVTGQARGRPGGQEARHEGEIMSIETITALAAAGGAAIVQAAGTDTWNTVRTALSRLLSHGDTAGESAELERLDHTCTLLRQAVADDVTGRARLEGAWQARLETFLSGLDDHARTAAAQRLTDIIELAVTARGPVTHPKTVSAGGDISIRADHGVAGAVINVEGGMNIGTPLAPRRP
jgi:hypothetical protein